MKFLKNINFLFLGLTLVFSLVSFSGIANNQPSAIIKIAMVATDSNEDTRFSLHFFNVYRDSNDGLSKYSDYSFTRFQNNYDIKEFTAIKSYSNNTLWLRAQKLHMVLYSFNAHKTHYNDIV